MRDRVRKFMLVYLFVLPLGLLAQVPVELERLETAYLGKLADAAVDVEAEKVTILQKYGQLLDKMLAHFTQQGDLDKVLAIQARAKTFRHSQRIMPPENPNAQDTLSRAQRAYGGRIAALDKTLHENEQRLAAGYRQSLQALVKKLTIDGRLEDAIAVNAALERVQRPVARPTPEARPPSNAVAPPAAVDAIMKSAQIHYTFDRPLIEQKLNDDSGNGDHAEVRGAAKLVAGGISGGACSFAGEDGYVRLPRLGMPGKPFTLAVWVKSTERRKDQTLFELGGSQRGVIWYLKRGNLGFGVRTSESLIQSFGPGITDGGWHFVAVVLNARAVHTHYLDGKARGAYQNQFLDKSPVEGAQLGAARRYRVLGTEGEADDNTITDPFDGLMDEFRFFRRALSAEEIEALYKRFAR